MTNAEFKKIVNILGSDDFSSFAGFVNISLDYAIEINDQIRKCPTVVLTDSNLRKLDEIRRDVKIIRSRISIIESKHSECYSLIAETLAYIECKTSSRKKSQAKMNEICSLLHETTRHTSEFSKEFQNAGKKWMKIEDDIIEETKKKL